MRGLKNAPRIDPTFSSSLMNCHLGVVASLMGKEIGWMKFAIRNEKVFGAADFCHPHFSCLSAYYLLQLCRSLEEGEEEEAIARE